MFLVPSCPEFTPIFGVVMQILALSYTLICINAQGIMIYKPDSFPFHGKFRGADFFAVPVPAD